MVPLTRLMCPEDVSVREEGASGRPLSDPIKPIVTWHITRSCNLNCVRCHTDSSPYKFAGELSTEDAEKALLDLRDFEIPHVIIAGGEPLMRPDLFQIAERASELQLPVELESNGTLLTKEMAKKIKDAGFSQVTVSLDGIGSVNDFLRGKPGAFRRAEQGLKNLKFAGVRTGVRFTLTRQNLRELKKIFDFTEQEGLSYIRVSHLVYTGRGAELKENELAHKEKREALTAIFERAWRLSRDGKPIEILISENSADRVFLLLWAERTYPEAATIIGDRLGREDLLYGTAGVRSAAIDACGDVHPDRYWLHYTLGSLKEKRFLDIWTDLSDPLMEALKDHKRYLKGRCSLCRWLNLCSGSLRVRADIVYDDPLAPDPACYLTDEEIGLCGKGKEMLREKNELYDVPEAYKS